MIVFMFWIIIGNLTALDYTLVMLFIFMFKILKKFFSFKFQNQRKITPGSVRDCIAITMFLISFTLERGRAAWRPQARPGVVQDTRSDTGASRLAEWGLCRKVRKVRSAGRGHRLW